MTKYVVSLILLLSFVFIFSGCRPKDLEGAFVDYNAGRYDNALMLAEKVTKEHPENSEGWYLLGVLYGKKDRIPDMVNAFNKSLGVDQTHKQKIDIEMQNYYAKKFNSGAQNYNSYIKAEDPTSEKAIKTIEEAIQNFKDANTIKSDFRALNLIAQGYKMMGNDEAAMENFQKLTEAYPDSADAWVNLGKYYYESKDYNKGVEMFDKAQQIDPKNSEALLFLAQSYDIMEQPDKAIPIYKKALEVNQEDSAIPFNLGLLLYKSAIAKGANADLKNEKLAEAITYLGKAIELNPEFQSSYQLKGNAELLLQKYEDAKVTLEDGVNKFPEDAQMWNDLGVCYTQLNDKEKAEAAFSKADALKN
ncbi:MAG: tetratricopeptide repeat protein [Calditrichae bacterium]|nr:tetratricopeptide repeat protein [Calditrichota bacterium]MCB9057655.1 tetratricopeptide repeat protein [Calditrichia bacterium]